MTRLPYMPVWVADFVADTQHLDARETGALVLLLFAAWLSPTGGLPDDDRQLARLARASNRDWKKMRPLVLAEWELDAMGQWHHSRLDEERQLAAERSALQRRRAEAKWLKDNERGSAAAVPGLSRGNASHNQNHNQTQNQNQTQSERERPPAPARAVERRGPRGPLLLTGADGIWKLRLLGHRPGGAWKTEWGPPPESAEPNPHLRDEQRRQWRLHWGLAGNWRQEQGRAA